MVVYPVSRGSLSIRELACLHLANDNSASIYESLHGYCVGCGGWIEAIPGAVAVARFHASDIVDVFYPQTNAREGLLRSFRVV